MAKRKGIRNLREFIQVLSKSGLILDYDENTGQLRIEIPQKFSMNIGDPNQGLSFSDNHGNSYESDPNGVRIGDKSGNQVNMSQSGVDIKSGGAVSISGSSIDISGSGKVTINGATVSIN